MEWWQKRALCINQFILERTVFYAEVVGCADLYGRVCRIGCIVFCGFLPFFLVGVKCS